MKELKELTFPPEAEEMAIKYATFLTVICWKSS